MRGDFAATMNRQFAALIRDNARRALKARKEVREDASGNRAERRLAERRAKKREKK